MSSTVNEEWCIATVDAVQRIEDRRVHDGTEPLTGGVRRARSDQRVNEDLVPLEHRVAKGRFFRGLAGRVERTREQEGQPDEKAGGSGAEGCGFHGIPFHSTPLTFRGPEPGRTRMGPSARCPKGCSAVRSRPRAIPGVGQTSRANGQKSLQAGFAFLRKCSWRYEGVAAHLRVRAFPPGWRQEAPAARRENRWRWLPRRSKRCSS